MHLSADDANDLPRTGIRTVGNHAADIVRQLRQSRSHQHRSGTHGYTGEKNGRFRAESLIGPIHPVQTVVLFPDTEGNGAAAALAVGPLVHDQGVLSRFPGQHVSAAEILDTGRAVAMKLQLQRCAVCHMVVTTKEYRTIPGGDAHRFKGHGVHGADKGMHPFLFLFILTALRQLVNILMMRLRGIEGHPVTNDRSSNRRCQKRGNQPKHMVHLSFYRLFLSQRPQPVQHL